MLSDVETIINYWFGEAINADLPNKQRTHLWFGNNPEVDNEINKKFSHLVEQAINDMLENWREQSRGMLALIILLDQFSRNIYRGTSKAFAQDGKALAICLQGIKEEKDQELSLIERVFFYLPLEHTEDLHIQAKSVQAFQGLMELSLPETRPMFETFLDYAVEHFKVIEEFGRFPHRNTILNRESTVKEKAYLQSLNA